MKVKDVYGDTHYVARADFDGPRVQITLRTSSGMKLGDYHERMGWKDKPTTIHRANITEVS